MKKKIFSIWSVLLVLVVSIALLVPGCAPTTGTIEVKATLDGSSWTGAVQYTLTALTGTGAGSPINGTSVDASHRVDPGIWACAYVSGGPAGASFVNISVDITLTGNQTVIAGGTVTFTLNFVAVYDLTMAENPVGGGTATDLTDTPPYEANTAVNISAVAAACYRFVDWTATAGTLANANAAQTTFTMPARDVTVTANFELTPLDHFRCYDVEYAPETYIGTKVELVDQFGAINATVGEAAYFGNPVKKVYKDVTTPISNENNHLTFYRLEYEEEPDEEQYLQVTVTNQFGDNQELIVYSIPAMLGVPTQKLSPEEHDTWDCLDHFLVYYVWEVPGTVASVDLEDQFGDPEQGVDVYCPVLFANPVKKTCDGEITKIENPNLENHLVFYYTDTKEVSKEVAVSNQFDQFGEQQVFNVVWSDLLAVPSEKVNFAELEQLDHFKGYPLGESAPIDADVSLTDQFVVDVQATVKWPWYFCNPVEKEIIEGPPTPILYPDNHLTLYSIWPEAEPQTWFVVVENQFGIEELYVEGPIGLVVPTQKVVPGDHGPPSVGLNHFLLYAVVGEPLAPKEPVILHDQFAPEGEEVTVGKPVYFANPVQKEHPGGTVTYIQNPWAHLLFYEISGTEIDYDAVTVVNQFGPPILGPLYPADLLGVPSLKLYAEPAPD